MRLYVNNTKRAAFSLAELMIAIGIFGVGLMMVAATFPVGLDQTRIIAEESMAPTVANEAFSKLHDLLNDPNKRFYKHPSNERLSFRDALVTSDEEFHSKFRDDVYVNSHPEAFDFNDWLTMPVYDLDATTNIVERLGGQAGFHPSVPGGCVYQETNTSIPRYLWKIPSNDNANLIEPQYCWNALYRVYNDNGIDMVEFAVFVNKRDYTKPVLISATFPMAPPVPSGHKMVYSASGKSAIGILYANKKAWHPTEGFVEYNPGFPSSGTFTIAYIPIDPITGRSPNVAVYLRSFPL